jgi:toxin ParE1/3/4
MAHRLAPEAKVDLVELWSYVSDERSIEAADRLVDSISARFVLLSRHPHVGRQRDDLRIGSRSFPVGNYIVLYRIDGDDVVIQRVVRGSRDLEALFHD